MLVTGAFFLTNNFSLVENLVDQALIAVYCNILGFITFVIIRLTFRTG